MTPIASLANRSEAGFALTETLLTVAVSAMLFVPLMAWILVATRSEVVVRDVSVAGNAENSLRTAILSDVASSTSVELAPSPSLPGVCGAAVGTVLFTLEVPAGSAPAATLAYVVGSEDRTWGRGGRQIRRVRCSSGSVVENSVVASPVWAPAIGWATAARCTDVDCRAFEFEFGGPRASQVTIIAASRRLGID